LLRVLLYHRIEKRLRDSKSCPPKTADRLSKVNQAALGSKIENPKINYLVPIGNIDLLPVGPVSAMMSRTG
jgi:hypothetical protein